MTAGARSAGYHSNMTRGRFNFFFFFFLLWRHRCSPSCNDDLSRRRASSSRREPQRTRTLWSCLRRHSDRKPLCKLWSPAVFNHCALLSCSYITGPLKENKREMTGVRSEWGSRATLPCCSLALYVFLSPGGALSHFCLRRQVLPQLPLLGFPSSSLPLKILFIYFFFPFAASAFFSTPPFPLLHPRLPHHPPSKCFISPPFLFSHFDCVYLSSESSG